MQDIHLQSNQSNCLTKEWNFMYAVDNGEHFEGFIHADSLEEAREQIKGTEYKIHSVLKVK